MDDVLRVVKEAHSNRCKSQVVREYVLSNAMVLCSAKVEVYIEDIISDWARAISTTPCLSKALPGPTRALHISKINFIAQKRFLLDGDEGKFLKSLANQLNHNGFLYAIDDETVPGIKHEWILESKKYPSPENIEHVFKRIGIDNVFHRLNHIARKDVKAIINSFNDTRTVLAHDGLPPGINKRDIVSKIRGEIAAVSYIDRLLYAHFTSHTGTSSWRTQ